MSIIALATLATFSPDTALAQSAVPPSAQLSGGSSLDQPSDAQLERTVKGLLARDPLTRGAHIEVRTQDRLVILSGRVQSARVAARAVQLVAGVNGVKGIENQLESRGS